MTDIKKQVEELEAAEQTLQAKRAELDKVNAETEDTKAKKQADIAALDAELNRVKSDIETKKRERREIEQGDKSFQERMRGENLAAAQEKFFSEFQVKPEDRAQYLEAFKRFDSGALNPDLILQDFRRTFAFLNADTLIDTSRRVEVLRQGSNEFNEAMSSASFSGNGFSVRPQDETLTQEELQAAKFANITPEKYKELKKQGKLD
jgi:hypothetical protein